MINYSAIPIAKKPVGPWDNFKLAVIATVGLFSLMGLIAAVTAIAGYGDSIMTLFGPLLYIVGFGLAIRALLRGAQLFKDQKKWMQQFAIDNGWEYEDSKRTVSDLAVLSPSYKFFAPPSTRVRCTVYGEIQGMHFELAHITYFQSTGMIGALSSNVGRRRIAWTSVLCLDGLPKLTEFPSMQYEKDDVHTFVVCGLNALYRHDIQAMFESVVLDKADLEMTSR